MLQRDSCQQCAYNKHSTHCRLMQGNQKLAGKLCMYIWFAWLLKSTQPIKRCYFYLLQCQNSCELRPFCGLCANWYPPKSFILQTSVFNPTTILENMYFPFYSIITAHKKLMLKSITLNLKIRQILRPPLVSSTPLFQNFHYLAFSLNRQYSCRMSCCWHFSPNVTNFPNAISPKYSTHHLPPHFSHNFSKQVTL